MRTTAPVATATVTIKMPTMTKTKIMSLMVSEVLSAHLDIMSGLTYGVLFNFDNRLKKIHSDPIY